MYLENQDLNDCLLKTLAWINNSRRYLIPNNKKFLSFQKYAVSERVVV